MKTLLFILAIVTALLMGSGKTWVLKKEREATFKQTYTLAVESILGKEQK